MRVMERQLMAEVREPLSDWRWEPFGLLEPSCFPFLDERIWAHRGQLRFVKSKMNTHTLSEFIRHSTKKYFYNCISNKFTASNLWEFNLSFHIIFHFLARLLTRCTRQHLFCCLCKKRNPRKEELFWADVWGRCFVKQRLINCQKLKSAAHEYFMNFKSWLWIEQFVPVRVSVHVDMFTHSLRMIPQK